MKVLAMLGLILLVTLFMGACGGGGSSFGGSAKLQSAGTPKGTYTITVTATTTSICGGTGSCGTTVTSKNFTLNVQ
jgi:hypothetical protein